MSRKFIGETLRINTCDVVAAKASASPTGNPGAGCPFRVASDCDSGVRPLNSHQALGAGGCSWGRGVTWLRAVLEEGLSCGLSTSNKANSRGNRHVSSAGGCAGTSQHSLRLLSVP